MSEEDGMQEAYKAMTDQQTRTIARLKQAIETFTEHRQVAQANLEAFVLDQSEAIRELDKMITSAVKALEKEAGGLYHLESMQLGRMPPTAVDRSVPPTPEQAQATAVAERTEEQIKLEKEFKLGKPAPGFPVERPSDAVVKIDEHGRESATWVHELPAHASPADQIDEQGRRHIRINGRHQIYSQHGKLISDEIDTQALEADQKAFAWLKEQGLIDDNGKLTEAGKKVQAEKLKTNGAT